jgi:hypothetical protein
MYNLQAGQLVVTGTLTLGSSSTFTQTNGGTFSFAAVNQNGGSTSIQPLILGTGGPGGTYTLGGGALTCSSITINSGGVFSQTGGSLDCPSINLNQGSASFPSIYLDTGSPVAGIVGAAAAGPVVTGSSGQLTATNEYLGFNAGIYAFVQASPLVYAPNNLYVGFNSSSTATYSQTSGVNNVGTLYLGSQNSSGTYNLQGGSVSAGLINVAGNSIFDQTGGTLSFAIFSQTGGNVTLPPLTLGAGHFYSASAGTLTCPMVTVNSGAGLNPGLWFARLSILWVVQCNLPRLP